MKKQDEGTFRRYFTDRNGKVHDAYEYGHRAWPIGKGTKKK